jgi:phage/plasmid-like protein (TIGR03299 family)
MTTPQSPEYDPTVNDWGTKYDVKEGPNHQIDETVTGGAFASVRQPAWHKLGVVVNEPVSAGKLLQLAKCDFDILRAPITSELEVPISPGSPLKVRKTATDTKRVNICRVHPETNELQILGQASPGYPLWTPRDTLVNFGDAILNYGEPTVSTCGALDEGRKVFMSFELPKEIHVGGVLDEQVRLWLTVSTSFDTSLPTMAMISGIRTVCANTLRVGKMKALSTYKVKKTKNAELAAEYARDALGLVLPYMDEFQEVANQMIATHMTNDQFRKIIEKEFGPGEDPSKKALTSWAEKESQLMALFADADTQANARNTAWGALNAVGEFADWFTKATGDPAQADAKRFTRSIFGEKSIADPKDNMARVIREFCGI